MEDKIFELLEKLYIEVTGLKGEVTGIKSEVGSLKGEVAGLKSEVGSLKGEVTGLKGEVGSLKSEFTEFKGVVEKRLNKIEIKQEQMDDKITESFEAITSLAEINDRQHKEIMNELKGDISVVKLAVNKIAK